MNNLHLLQLAAVAYSLAVTGYLLQLVLKKPWLKKLAFGCIAAGFLLQTACLA